MLSKNINSVRLINGTLTRQMSLNSKVKSSPKVLKLPSGVSIASLKSNSPLARVAIVVRAGSRYEPPLKPGLSHLIRSAAGLSTSRYTSFGVTRNIEYYGGTLTVAGNREFISYILEAHNNSEVLHNNLPRLGDTVANPAFKHWELSDSKERLEADLSVLADTPYIQLAEALHRTAFKGGLRNSLYAPKFALGKYSSNDLKQFHEKHFNGSNIAVVGVGVDESLLIESFTDSLALKGGSASKESSTFIGGNEVHIDYDSPLTYVALASEGAGLNKSKDVIALALLQRILGAGPQIKNADGLCKVTRLGRAVGAALGGKNAKNVSVSAFNLNYEDTGLFGFNLIAPAEYDLTAMVKAAVKEIRGVALSVSAEELLAAKKNLRNMAYMTFEDPSTLANEFALQLLNSNEKFSIEQFDKVLETITPKDFASVAEKIKKVKPSMASVGLNAPYLSDVLAMD